MSNENANIVPRRMANLDVMKGIGILCIVAGHIGYDHFSGLVFMFHVPLFFLVSGYHLSEKKPFHEFAVSRFKALMIPYFITSLFMVLLKIPVGILHKQSWAGIGQAVWEMLLAALYASGSDGNGAMFGIGPIGAIWFLPALLIALLEVRWLCRFRYGAVAILLIAVLSYYSSTWIWLPWSAQAAGTAAVFTYFGFLCRKKQFDLEKINYPLAFAGVVALGIGAYFHVYLSIVRNYYGYGIVSAIVAILVTYLVLCVSNIIVKLPYIKDWFCFWGRNSLIMLCIHLIELTYIRWDLVIAAPIWDRFPMIVSMSIVVAAKFLLITLGTIAVNYVLRRLKQSYLLTI